MKYEKKIALRDGRICTLRSVQLEDAPKMITCLKETAGETRFLLREAEEVTITLEQEEEFIQKRMGLTATNI